MKRALNIFWLGLKELRSLTTDLVMVAFVVYAFTLAIYVQATGTSSEVNNASIAFVDEDESALSKELFNAFYPPRFKLPERITASEVEPLMDATGPGWPATLRITAVGALGAGISRAEAPDTTRAITGVAFSGDAAKFPDIRFIWSHAGGTAPFLASRIDGASRGAKEKMPDGFMATLKTFYYDLAGATNAGGVRRRSL